MDKAMKIRRSALFVRVGWIILAALLGGCEPNSEMSGEVRVHVQRLADGPIITPATHASIGENIQGPSLIRVPDWVENPLGRYYLYFADHKGAYIRLAYANDLTGPWRVHPPGSLRLEDSHFPVEPPVVPPDGRERVYRRYREAGMDPSDLPHDPIFEMTAPHIASPDVHVDEENRRIVMYFHGLQSFGQQLSRVAISTDGIHFEAREEILGRTYMRAFEKDGMT
jgi:hypothetical protein